MIWFLLLTLLVVMTHCAKKTSPELQYIVAIDAGSAGSRAAAYKFQMNLKTNEFILDDDEKYAKIDGALGYYVNNCTEGAAKIKELLQSIKKKLNLEPEVLAKTQVILGGTGGLRNLKPSDAEKLLAEVRKVIKKSGFLVKDNAVKVIDGVDEGIFSWFSVNYILDSWNSPVSTLDVGGASIELSFSQNDESIDYGLKDHLYTLSTSNGAMKPKTNMFTISYSNLGGRNVRKIVSSHGNPKGATDLYTICMHPKSEPSSFPFGTVTYKVHGSPNENGTVNFQGCMDLIRDKTLKLLTPQPIPLKNESDIYIISGFFTMFKGLGLIHSVQGGEVLLSTILSSARNACSVPNNNNPFLCHDLIYAYVLLHDGFGMKSDAKVHIFQKLKSHNISWTLGYAYDRLAGLKRRKKK